MLSTNRLVGVTNVVLSDLVPRLEIAALDGCLRLISLQLSFSLMISWKSAIMGRNSNRVVLR
jgi:hypothetical protein